MPEYFKLKYFITAEYFLNFRITSLTGHEIIAAWNIFSTEEGNNTGYIL